LAELTDSLQGTFFRDYRLDLEILDFLPEDVSFDWYGLMRDAITPALLTAPHLSSGFISRRCEELLRAYQDASSLVYQHELEIHELRRHLEAARLRYLQHLSSCATLRSIRVSGEPARLLMQELEVCHMACWWGPLVRSAWWWGPPTAMSGKRLRSRKIVSSNRGCPSRGHVL
jgi:hypothetical protein